VRLAWIYLRERPVLEAIERFTTSLRRFAAHERDDSAKDWDSFRTANRDLFERRPSVLDRYYAPRTLASDLARRTFVLPDAGMGGKDSSTA
jgi:hypothetical protein